MSEYRKRAQKWANRIIFLKKYLKDRDTENLREALTHAEFHFEKNLKAHQTAKEWS